MLEKHVNILVFNLALLVTKFKDYGLKLESEKGLADFSKTTVCENFIEKIFSSNFV